MRSVLACLPRFVIFPGLISRQGHIDMHAGSTEELDQLDIAFRAVINPRQFAASQNVGGMLHACPTRYAWQSRAVAV
jgi:hypothetical protein